MAREIRQENPYMTKLLKLIPSEIIAAYLVIVGFIPDGYEQKKLILIIISVALLILIPFYMGKLQDVKLFSQKLLAMVSFVVWLYTLGGVFVELGIYEAFIGSIILVFWTLLIPLFYPSQP